VDRVLASPRYGERWARHWLDVVHFGETHGYDKDKLRPNAWPYRDYVIRAFNANKPYSRFVQEQLAGDVLFPGDPDGIIATGFIAAGPWDYVGHVELPITKTDGLIARYNDRDDMVMTTMSTFQSLTVHCARCHDHKFDPIPQRDYYGLQAVFAGVDRANRPYDSDQKLKAHRDELLAQSTKFAVHLAELKSASTNLSAPELAVLDQRIEAAKKALAAFPAVKGKRGKTLGYHSNIEKSQEVTKWVEVDLGVSMNIDAVVLVPAFEIFGPHDGPGFGFPTRFQVRLYNNKAANSESVALASESERDFPNPGNQPYLIEASNPPALFV
jgi:hypothetical protein